ncbi:hypothetical protein L1049_027821 [Liquidambar formosana]|uniref:Uncharacterized protein n=1 Tax=Liquidambar formosana TaxID=63359 RepID=A0AAP0WST3_LIQFO
MGPVYLPGAFGGSVRGWKRELLSKEWFDIPHEGAWERVLENFNSCWRDWKDYLKLTWYDSETPMEDNLVVPPDEGLIDDQWVHA